MLVSESSAQEIRGRIEECRADLARAEGEAGSYRLEIEAAMGELRDVLGCRAGQERAAIKKLRAKVASGEDEVAELLDELEGEEGD